MFDFFFFCNQNGADPVRLIFFVSFFLEALSVCCIVLEYSDYYILNSRNRRHFGSVAPYAVNAFVRTD